MPTSKSYTVRDFDGEKSVYGWNTEQVAPDGSNLLALEVANGTLNAAIYDITRFAAVNQQQFSNIIRGTQSPNADPEAQREEKWLCTYEDTTEFLDPPTNLIPNPGFHKIFNLEIPIADLSLRVGNSEIVYTQAGGGVAQVFTDFVAAFNLVVKSPYGGVAAMLEVRSVGRNT